MSTVEELSHGGKKKVHNQRLGKKRVPDNVLQ
jgi:hypothetical protein